MKKIIIAIVSLIVFNLFASSNLDEFTSEIVSTLKSKNYEMYKQLFLNKNDLIVLYKNAPDEQINYLVRDVMFWRKGFFDFITIMNFNWQNAKLQKYDYSDVRNFGEDNSDLEYDDFILYIESDSTFLDINFGSISMYNNKYYMEIGRSIEFNYRNTNENKSFIIDYTKINEFNKLRSKFKDIVPVEVFNFLVKGIFLNHIESFYKVIDEFPKYSHWGYFYLGNYFLRQKDFVKAGDNYHMIDEKYNELINLAEFHYYGSMLKYNDCTYLRICTSRFENGHYEYDKDSEKEKEVKILTNIENAIEKMGRIDSLDYYKYLIDLGDINLLKFYNGESTLEKAYGYYIEGFKHLLEIDTYVAKSEKLGYYRLGFIKKGRYYEEAQELLKKYWY